MVSVRVIRVLDDTFTVEVEAEEENVDSLMQELNKSLEGRKVIFLLQRSLEEVKPAVPESMMDTVRADEERLREEGRKEMYQKAKEKGINLEVLLGESAKAEEQKEAKAEA